MPYFFSSTDFRIKDLEPDLGDLIEIVKTIAEDHGINIKKFILMGYATGHISVCFL
jgi:predicted esterase